MRLTYRRGWSMKALQVTAHGRPGEVLAVRTIERPEPGPGEVRVRVGAASLNFNDIDRCRGKLVSVPTPPPFTLGMDVCGVVDAAGEGAEAVAGQAGGRHHQDGAGRHRRVRHRPRRLGVRCPRAARRRRGHRLRAHLPDLASGPVPPGAAPRRRDPGGALGGQRAGHRRDPTGQGGRSTGHRRGRRAPKRERCAPRSAPTWSSTTPPRTSSKRCWPPPAMSGADVVYDLAGGDFVERSWRCTARGGRYLAVGFADDDEQRHDRTAAADGLHRQHRHRGRHGGLGGVGRPGHATVRLQPVRAGRGRRDPRRPAAPGGRRSDPALRRSPGDHGGGGRRARRRTRSGAPWVAPSSRWPLDRRRLHLARLRVDAARPCAPSTGWGRSCPASGSTSRR